MRITRLSLTNFRAFKQTQTLEFAPVTLLFGPNSVGKSTVLMALAYLQQILGKSHCDPQRLEALGDKNIGGFRSLVFGQDLTQPIIIRIDYEVGGSLFSAYESYVSEIGSQLDVLYLLMNDIAFDTKQCSVEFEIVWSDKFSRAYVRDYRLWLNDEYIGLIRSSEDLKNTRIVELNTQSKLLTPDETDDWLEREYGEIDEREPLDETDDHTELEQVLNSLNPSGSVEAADTTRAGCQFINRIAPLGIACSKAGAIPLLGRSLISNLEGVDVEASVEHFNRLVLTQVLSQAFVLPLDKLLEFLQNTLFIGPLRVVPDIDYQANPNPEQSDWVDGSAAWDLLHQNPASANAKSLLSKANDWFVDEDKFNTGYSLINHSITEFSNCEVNNQNKSLNSLLEKRHFSFKTLDTGIYLSANQLGTGISQVLPIVVAASYEKTELISIEQPELHIHPRFQTELGDLFLEASQKQTDNKSFLIETHSEHLILRLLRRVRETSENDNTVTKVKPDDISVLYLSPGAEGVKVERIEVTEDGDFEKDWPDGFFDERDEELF
jgi:hypothetical protein